MNQMDYLKLARHHCVALSCVAAFFWLGPDAQAADWREFRGNDAKCLALDAKLPLAWSDKENITWKSPLPGRGASSPIVVSGRVIVTCSSGTKQDRLHVVCFDAAGGKQLWERQFWATGRTLCHPFSAVAANTPTSDGKRVFAFYSSNDLACLDLDGNLIWYRGLASDYPAAGNDAGMSSSPVFAGDTVIVQVESQGDSFAAGIDPDTGENRWKIDRKKMSSWASPVAIRADDSVKDVVLLQGPSGLSAHDAYTGRELWKHGEECAGISSTTVVGETLFVPGAGLMALRPNGEGKPPEVLWRQNKLGATACSPVIHDGKVYTINRTILVCGDAATGDVLWQLRLDNGQYWATPILTEDHLYVISYDGQAQVVKLPRGDAKAEIVGKSNFGEQILGTPAVANGAMFVRSDAQLWKIAK
jgi:outer membrane protein assembly factor BamB